jgi:hypothetical protein
MRPDLPDSSTLQALRATSPEDRAAEVDRARAFVQAAQLYLNWAEMGQQLVQVFDMLAGSPNGESRSPYVDYSVIETKTTVGSGKSLAAAANSAQQIANYYTGRPSLRKAILAVMAEDPERVWKKSEIMAQLKNHGWEPKGGKPSSQLATRLAEMIGRGEVRRVSVGHYTLVLPQETT